MSSIENTFAVVNDAPTNWEAAADAMIASGEMTDHTVVVVHDVAAPAEETKAVDPSTIDCRYTSTGKNCYTEGCLYRHPAGYIPGPAVCQYGAKCRIPKCPRKHMGTQVAPRAQPAVEQEHPLVSQNAALIARAQALELVNQQLNAQVIQLNAQVMELAASLDATAFQRNTLFAQLHASSFPAPVAAPALPTLEEVVLTEPAFAPVMAKKVKKAKQSPQCRYTAAEKHCYDSACPFTHPEGYVPGPRVNCKAGRSCTEEKCKMRHPE